LENGDVRVMDNYKDQNSMDFDFRVIEVFRIHKRLGLRYPRVGIFRCWMRDDEPGLSVEFYDNDHNVYLHSWAEKDCKNINLHELANRFANAIKAKTGIGINVIHRIQGTREEYDEYDRNMWHAKMVMQGIDNDY
jgi:hypothetical protein